MVKFRFSHFWGIYLSGFFTIFSNGQSIDLTGKIVTSTGNGIGNAAVSLLKARLTDTTDASGVFRISGELLVVNHSVHQAGTHLVAGAIQGIDVFDCSGKLVKSVKIERERTISQFRNSEIMSGVSLRIIRVQTDIGSFSYQIVTPGKINSIEPFFREIEPLLKTSAVVDTLFVTKPGFKSRKIAIQNLKMNVDTIQLQAASSEFEIRKPSERTLTCQTTQKEYDVDYYCDCENDSLHATLYVQSRPESCGPMSAINYVVEKAWIKTSGGIEVLEEVLYNGGGNHHNDRLTFLWNKHYVSFYHSSTGFGWRVCTTPDCMQICKDAECRTILYDGCARTACASRPSLKVRCVQVNTDGTVPARFDPWIKSEGNPYPLPCAGDPLCK
jgi:hypothetical protein